MNKQTSIKQLMKTPKTGLLVILVLIVTFSIACEKLNDNKYSPPADHTINRGGYLHKTGLSQPLSNCVSCHGSDLKGGTTGVSCFECHSQKW